MESARLPTEDFGYDDENYEDLDPRSRTVVHADPDDAEVVMRAEPLTKDEFSVMSMDTPDQTGEYYDEERVCSGSFRILALSMSFVLVIALLAVLLPGIRDKSDALEVLRTPARLPVEYSCKEKPSASFTDEAPGHDAESFDQVMSDQYEEVSAAITDNMTDFLESFRESHFDAWEHTYSEVKEGMYPFKSTYFPPYLQDGSTIYESACGIGLNLFMTLEILQESKGIENLFVYGSELLEASVDKANAVMDQIAPARSRKGRICQGDSSNLDFVPSNAFDLVYTGYLSPLLDPLHFELEEIENVKRYNTLCEADPQILWAEASLNQIAQERQNEWFGEWVAEMARIAKPGVPVIVEQVSNQYCDAAYDWGGVSRQWWHDVATNNTYGWNVDPESIVIEDDTIFRGRYHVFMIKNGKREAR